MVMKKEFGIETFF